MRPTGLHHIDLVVSSIERSLPFYRELLEPLGYTRVGEVEGEREETIWYIVGPRVGVEWGCGRRRPKGSTTATESAYTMSPSRRPHAR